MTPNENPSSSSTTSTISEESPTLAKLKNFHDITRVPNFRTIEIEIENYLYRFWVSGFHNGRIGVIACPAKGDWGWA